MLYMQSVLYDLMLYMQRVLIIQCFIIYSPRSGRTGAVASLERAPVLRLRLQLLGRVVLRDLHAVRSDVCNLVDCFPCDPPPCVDCYVICSNRLAPYVLHKLSLKRIQKGEVPRSMLPAGSMLETAGQPRISITRNSWRWGVFRVRVHEGKVLYYDAKRTPSP